MLNITETTRIIFHFNKKFLEDSSIPMWIIKVKGETYYVDHINSKIGFSTKETPDNPSTKGSIKFKGKIKIEKIDNKTIATIY